MNANLLYNLVGALILPVVSTNASGSAQPLKLEKVGTEQVYFSYHGKPLLSFGGLSDFIFYAAEDAYDYKQWADWAAQHGINHVRAYPPMSWKCIVEFAKENGGDPSNALFPYKETKPGSRQFDLTKFNEEYWKRFRQKCEYLQKRGVIVHLLMVNGWQITSTDERNWRSHFFNPKNNVNKFTHHLQGNPSIHFYFSVADKKEGLVQAQKTWLAKLIEETVDLDNVYYDLDHEIARHARDWLQEASHWKKAKMWIDEMSKAIQQNWERLNPNRPLIMGLDAGPMTQAQRDWIYSRPYFNVLIFGKAHNLNQAKQWRIQYNKPYIPQESWDDDGQKYSYIHPEQQVHSRKYMWKFMMAKCQQMDLYMKPRIGFSSENLPKYPHNYDPRGWNRFADDAVVLRAFWDSLTDYPNLWFNGTIVSGPGSHQYVLSSKKDAVAYCSSATGKEGVKFKGQTLRLKDLSVAGGTYTMDIIKPDRGVRTTRSITVRGGTLSVKLPAFVDDIAVHIYRPH
jgi:hypothetical protein